MFNYVSVYYDTNNSSIQLCMRAYNEESSVTDEMGVPTTKDYLLIYSDEQFNDSTSNHDFFVGYETPFEGSWYLWTQKGYLG